MGRREFHTGGAHVVRVNVAEFVVVHLADKPASAAEGGNAGRGISGRATGNLSTRTHLAIQRLGLGLVDQVHRARHQFVTAQKFGFGGANNVDNGVADTNGIKQIG